jgi:hypothetical protein
MHNAIVVFVLDVSGGGAAMETMKAQKLVLMHKIS